MLICYQNELKFLKIVYFEGSYLHLYKLLCEWPLNLILLPGYNTRNSIWNSINWLIYNIITIW